MYRVQTRVGTAGTWISTGLTFHCRERAVEHALDYYTRVQTARYWRVLDPKGRVVSVLDQPKVRIR